MHHSVKNNIEIPVVESVSMCVPVAVAVALAGQKEESPLEEDSQPESNDS